APGYAAPPRPPRAPAGIAGGPRRRYSGTMSPGPGSWQGMSEQPRTLRLCWCEPGRRYGVVRLGGGEASDFFFLGLPYSKRGRAATLTRLVPGVGGAEEVTACLGDEDSPPFCSCAAAKAAGRCEHLDAMRALLAAGRVA